MGVEIINTKGREKVAINRRELKIGTRIERKEHGFNIKISKKIAMDHIKEYPQYYTHKRYGLIVIEKKMKRKNG